jgi:two-component system chemotaxis response regulator CheB
MGFAAIAQAPPGKAARPLRLVVLDDDAVFRTVLSRLLTSLGLEVVAACSTIESARKRLAGGDVDAVTVDVVLRNESGLDFLKWCRATHPSVITVLVTAGTEKGARTGVDAVFLGASALLTKPDAKSLAGFEDELRRVFADGKGREPSAQQRRPIVPPSGPRLKPEPRRDLLAIGSSTGGPPALLKVLKGLPAWFTAPIVITQHMPSLHLGYLAELLTQQGGRPVEVAMDRAPLQKGRAYLAGHGKHLTIERVGGQLVSRHFDGPAEHHCKPAVDPMFRSIAQVCPGTCLALVLTGMGADGAKGAVALRQTGNPVLIQDQDSSVVWGMPGAVMNAGAADAVASIDRLSQTVLEWMAWPQGGTR